MFRKSGEEVSKPERWVMQVAAFSLWMQRTIRLSGMSRLPPLIRQWSERTEHMTEAGFHMSSQMPCQFSQDFAQRKKKTKKKHWLFQERQKPLLLTCSLVLRRLNTAWQCSGHSASLSKTWTWDPKDGPTLPAWRIRFGYVRIGKEHLWYIYLFFLPNITILSRRQKFGVCGAVQKILLRSVTQRNFSTKKNMGYYKPSGCWFVCNQKAAS